MIGFDTTYRLNTMYLQFGDFWTTLYVIGLARTIAYSTE